MVALGLKNQSLEHMLAMLRILTLVLLLALAGTAYAKCTYQLLPCPNSPNCVSTNDPVLERRFIKMYLQQSTADAWINVRNAVAEFKRVEFVEERYGYLRAKVSSFLFGFVDDLEVTLCDGGGSLAVRSASRMGHWDIGANRRRLEVLAEHLRSSKTIR